MVHASFLDVLTEDVVVYLAVSHVLGSQYVESVVAMLKNTWSLDSGNSKSAAAER
jgi:hypothetical protein